MTTIKGWYLVSTAEAADAPNTTDAYYGYGDADPTAGHGAYLPTYHGAVVRTRKAADALARKFAAVWRDQGESVAYEVAPLDLDAIYPDSRRDEVAAFVGQSVAA